VNRGVTFEWGGIYPSSIFLLPKNNFIFAADLKRGKKKNWGESGEKGVGTLKTGSNQSSHPHPFRLDCFVSYTF